MRWLGSEWQVDWPPSPPPSSSFHNCLNTYTCPHIHLHYQSRLCLLVLRFLGKTPVVRAYKREEHKPSFTDGDAISTGAVGGYQGDSSTSTLPRWLAWHCHLSPKNLHVSHSTQGVTQSVNQSEALDFVKWLLRFLSHLLRRYMRS